MYFLNLIKDSLGGCYDTSTNEKLSHASGMKFSSVRNDRHHIATNTPPQPKPQKYVYPTRSDGACFFRAYLAYETNNPEWLATKSLDEVMIWVDGALDSSLINKIYDFSNTQYELYADFDNPEKKAFEYLLKINPAMREDFIQALFQTALTNDGLHFWNAEIMRGVLNSLFMIYLSEENISLTEEQAALIIDTVFAAFIDRYNMPVNSASGVNIERMELAPNIYHYQLVSDEPIVELESARFQVVAEDRVEASRLNEYVYIPLQSDNLEQLRLFIAYSENSTVWLNAYVKNQQDINRWLVKKGDVFKAAIKDAADKLYADDYLTARAIRKIITPDLLTVEMLTNPDFNIFDSDALQSFTNAFDTELNSAQAQIFIQHLTTSLNLRLGMYESTSEDGKQIYRINSNTYIDNHKGKQQDPWHLITIDHRLGGNSPLRIKPAPPYIKDIFKKDNRLALYRTYPHNKSESLYRSYAALFLEDDLYLTLDPKVLAQALFANKQFKSALTASLSEVLTHYLGQQFDCQSISHNLIHNYFKKGIYDLNFMLNALHNDLLNPTVSQLDELRIHFPNGFSENLLNDASIKTNLEVRLINLLGYKIISRADFDANRRPKDDEYFVFEPNGNYSFVTISNLFKPEYLPRDKKIYEEDLEHHPDRDNVAKYLQTHFGKQVFDKKNKSQPRRRNKRHGTNKAHQQGYRHYQAFDMYKDANQWERENVKKGKNRANIDDIRRRDGLFSEQDGLNAGLEMLSSLSESLNTIAENVGFNTKPRIPKKPSVSLPFSDQNTEPKHPQNERGTNTNAANEVNKAAKKRAPIHLFSLDSSSEKNSNPEINLETNTGDLHQGNVTSVESIRDVNQKAQDRLPFHLKTDAKESITIEKPPQPEINPNHLDKKTKKIIESDDDEATVEDEDEEQLGWFRFPGAKAAPIRLVNQDKGQKFQQDYDLWHNQHHSIHKRRVEYTITAEQIMKAKIEDVTDLVTASETARLQSVLNSPLADYEGAAKPAIALRHDYIYQELNLLRKSNSIADMVVVDSLDALQMTLLERSEEFRKSYAFYWNENERSLQNQHEFYYHVDAEDYFPGKTNHAFQQLSRDPADLEFKRMTVLAEIYNKQSLGQDLEYKKLGMVFAHLDIDALSANSQIRTEALDTLQNNWEAYLKANPKAQDKFDKLSKCLTDRDINPKYIRPQSANQGMVMGRAASHAQNNMGYCQFYATGMLIGLENGNLNGLLEASRVAESIQTIATEDPVSAYRLTNGLNSANNDLQDLTLTDRATGNQVKEVYLEKQQASFSAMMQEIETSPHGFRLRIRSGKEGQHAVHSVAIAKVDIDGQKSFLLIDANLGLTNCLDIAHLKVALRSSVSALVSSFDEEHFSNIGFKTLEMTPEIIADLKQQRTWNNLGYEDLMSKPVEEFALKHFVTTDAEWSKYLPSINQDVNSKLSSDISAYKDQKVKLTADDLDYFMTKARKNHPAAISVDNMSNQDISHIIQPPESKYGRRKPPPPNDNQPPEKPARNNKPNSESTGDEPPPLPKNKPKKAAPISADEGGAPAIPNKPNKNKAPQPDVSDELPPPQPPSRGKKPTKNSETAHVIAPSLDAYLREQDAYDGTFTKDPVRRNPLKPEKGDLLTGKERVRISFQEDTDLSKIKPANIGKSILDELAKVEDDTSKLMAKLAKAEEIEFTAQKTSVAESVAQAPVNKLQQALELEKESLIKALDEKSIKAIPRKVIRDFVTEEMNKIPKFMIEQADIENHKLASQMNDFSALVNELITKQNVNLNEFEIDKSKSFGIDNKVVFKNKAFGKGLEIDLPAKLSTQLTEIKAGYQSRFENVKAAISDIDVHQQFKTMKTKAANIVDGAWSGTGKAMGIAGKVMAIVNLQSLIEQTKGAGHLDSVMQAHLGISLADVIIDNIANTVGTVNFLVKTISGSISTLSSLSHSLSAISTGASYVFNLVELGLYCYSYNKAENDFEKAMSEIAITFALARIALTTSSISVCSSFPPAAPLFMFAAIVLSSFQEDIQNKIIADLHTHAEFKGWGGELEQIYYLFADPGFTFIEKENKVIIVSNKAPGLKLEITENDIKLYKNEKHYKVEYIRTIKEKVEAYKLNMFGELDADLSHNTYFDESIYQKLKPFSPILQEAFNSQRYKREFARPRELSTSRFADPSPHVQSGDESARETFVQSVSSNHQTNFNNAKIDYEVNVKRTITDNIASCLVGQELLSQPLDYKTIVDDEEQDKLITERIKNIYFQGHSPELIYHENHCTQVDYKGRSGFHYNNYVGMLNACGEKNPYAIHIERKDGNYWNERTYEYTIPRVNYKYNQPRTKIFHNGKVAAIEYDWNDMGTWDQFYRWSGWSGYRSRVDWTLSYQENECYHIPNGISFNFNPNHHFKLSSGKDSPFIYHFPQDQLMQYLLDSDSKNKAYGTASAFNVEKHNIDKNNIPYKVILVADGFHNIYLYENTTLNMAEEKPINSEKTGATNFILPFEKLINYKKTNQPSAIIGHKNQIKILPPEHIPDPEVNQWGYKPWAPPKPLFDGSITINLDSSVTRPVYFDIINKDANDTYAFSIEPKFNDTVPSGLDLELHTLSSAKALSIRETTRNIQEKIAGLKVHLPNVKSNKVEIPTYDLSESSYHKTIYETEKSTKNITENTSLNELFESRGWFFEKTNKPLKEHIDHYENINDHPTMKELSALAVNKIWRHSAPDDMKEIFRRMKLVGFTMTNYVDIPDEFKPYCPDGESLTLFYFYDGITKKMVKQYGNMEIRTWAEEDFTLCAPEKIPQKVTWGDKNTESYSCEPIHLAPPTRVSGIGAGRLVALAEMGQEIIAAQSHTDNLFKIVYEKTKAVLNKQKAPSTSTEAPSTNTHIPVLIDLLGMEENKSIDSLLRLNAFLDNDNDDLNLSLIPPEEIPIAIPRGESFVLSMKPLTKNDIERLTKDQTNLFKQEEQYRTKNNLSMPQIVKLFSRLKVPQSDLASLSQAILTSTTKTLPDRYIPNSIEILPSKLITSVISDYDKEQFVLHLIEGIALSLSYDLSTVKLLGLSEDYLIKNKIGIHDSDAIRAAYQALKLSYGKPSTPYFRMQHGGQTEPPYQPWIFINTESEKVIYLAPQTQQGTYLSDDIAIIYENLEAINELPYVIVQDLTNKRIVKVSNCYHFHPRSNLELSYNYLSGNNDYLYISLNPSDKLNNQDVANTLPRLKQKNLILLPQQKSEFHQLFNVTPSMQKDLVSLTLSEATSANYETQQINIMPLSQMHQSTLSAKLYKKTVNDEEFYQLVLVVNSDAQNPSSDNALPEFQVKLEKAFSKGKTLKHAYDNKIKLNQKFLSTNQLQELVNNALVIDLDEIVKSHETEITPSDLTLNGAQFKATPEPPKPADTPKLRFD